ncbi:MAG: hypothetical protein ABIH89_08080 [Elusimicrobiota bacterium]
MIKKIITVFLMFSIAACGSMPKKNLTTHNGIIAAHFNVGEEEVASIKEKGFDEDSMLKILMISRSSYHSIQDVVDMMEAGETPEKIANDAGIEEAVFQERIESIKESISLKY